MQWHTVCIKQVEGVGEGGIAKRKKAWVWQMGPPPPHPPGSHVLASEALWRGPAQRRSFKWISITENWLARINHNKNGTCGLSSLKDLLPWDTSRSLSHHMPQWSTVDGKKRGGFSMLRAFFKKKIKNTVNFGLLFSLFFLYRYLPPSSAWPIFTFPVYLAYRCDVHCESCGLPVKTICDEARVCRMILCCDDDRRIPIGPAKRLHHGNGCGTSANGPTPRGEDLPLSSHHHKLPCCLSSQHIHTMLYVHYANTDNIHPSIPVWQPYTHHSNSHQIVHNFF